MVKLTNMCMIERGDEVLVQLREKKDWPGITFPGGKVDAGESVYDSVVREVWEETGLTIRDAKACGMIHYNVDKGAQEWIVFLYKAKEFSGELRTECPEGRVYWMKKKDLETAPVSNDIEEYMKVFEHPTFIEAYASWDGKTSSTFTFYK